MSLRKTPVRTTRSRPLPAAFMKLLSGTPKTEVLNLLDVQAYRYTGVTLNGFGRALIVYVIPTPAGRSTVLVCYAEGSASPYLAQCEDIVASLSLVGEPAAELRPDNTYGIELAAVVKRLDSDRRVLRALMSAGEPPSEVADLAVDLAGHFDQAKTALAAIEPPLAASATQTLLVKAIDSAREAYEALASAARDGSLVQYETARQGVETAEGKLDLALQSFVLLGYGSASSQ